MPLAPLVERPRSSALFLDFDGTLAPIVADPADARPLDGVPELLSELARRFSVVAVVSGRPAAFLVGVLGRPPGLTLIGLYGMEEVAADGRVVAAAAAERWRPVVAGVAATATAEAPAGIEVEGKGLSVTLHWRRSPDAATWGVRFAADAARASGLSVEPARMAVELRAPVPLDKGTVVAELARGHTAAAAFGDDRGDLPAFAALADLAAGGMAVARVAVADDETPAELVAAADVVVLGPAGAVELLGRLTQPGR